MSLKRAKLNIILKSDLCVGSGYSYAGIIDTDICYNNNGIPYIPARRLKGCLREAAEVIGIATNSVFGKSGEDSMSSISISNAYPEGYMEIDDEISRLKNSEFKDILSTQKVLEQFTYIKAQTAIDEKTGSSKENSLRYTRVVNRFSGDDGGELCFVADIEFSCDEAFIINAAKALRHIGMNRNRGLGNVRCYVSDVAELDDLNAALACDNASERVVCLKYVINNVSPLMLSGANDTKSERYISGQSVIGALARRYLSINGTDSEDDLFYDLFINGKVKYSNLYVTEKNIDENNNCIFNEFAPAPLYINKLKKSGKIVDVTTEFEKLGGDFETKGGNQPKKLKGKFVSFINEKISIREPLLDIVYHHSKANNYSHNSGRKNDNEGILYYLEVIKENQYFSGSIVGKKKYIDFILNMLENCSLKFGKSKTAQYGECVLVEKEITDYKPEFNIKKGDRVFVVFQSDGVFQNENGFTVSCDDVKEMVADYLGIKYNASFEENIFLETKIITGYNTKWNLKKPALPAIKAGSAFMYEASEDCCVKAEYVGVKNTEGFGKVKLYKYSSDLKFYEKYEYNEKIYEPDKSFGLIEKILLKDFADAIKEESMSTEKIDINASTLGRVNLMLRESLNEHKNNKKAAFDDFKNRVNSIKRKEEKRKVGVFLSRYLCRSVEFSIVKEANLEKLVIDINKIIGKENSASYAIYQKMKGLNIDALDDKVENLWGEYLENILVYQKYIKREG